MPLWHRRKTINRFTKILLCLILIAGQAICLDAPVYSKSTQTENVVAIARTQARSEGLTTASNNQNQYRYINLSENPLIYDQLSDYGYPDLSGAEKGENSVPGTIVYANHFGGDEAIRLATDGVVIGTDSHKNYVSLKSGNILFTPDTAMIIGTPEAKISIGAGATVFIMQSADSLVLYYLRQSQRKPNQLSILADKHKLIMQAGHMLVLTRQNTNDFEQLTANCHHVRYANTKMLDWPNESVKAFVADFSIVSALAIIKPLNRLLVSNNKQDRLALQQLVKDSAILGDLPSKPAQSAPIPARRPNFKVAADMDQ